MPNDFITFAFLLIHTHMQTLDLDSLNVCVANVDVQASYKSICRPALKQNV